MPRKTRPHTPDGRYLVSRGIMKRCTNPALDDSQRRAYLKRLMQARMQDDAVASMDAKIALGEAGPVWWDDGAADCSGLAPTDTPYATWWAKLSQSEQDAGLAPKRKRF